MNDIDDLDLDLDEYVKTIERTRLKRVADLLTVLTDNLTVVRLEKTKQIHLLKFLIKQLHGLFRSQRFNNSMTIEEIDKLLIKILKGE